MMIRLGIKRLFRHLKYLPAFIIQAFTYEFETCKKCGEAFRVRWDAKGAIWQKIMNRKDCWGGSMCLDCFVKRAEKQGIILTEDDMNYIDIFNPEVKRQGL